MTAEEQARVAQEVLSKAAFDYFCEREELKDRLAAATAEVERLKGSAQLSVLAEVCVDRDSLKTKLADAAEALRAVRQKVIYNHVRESLLSSLDDTLKRLEQNDG